MKMELTEDEFVTINKEEDIQQFLDRYKVPQEEQTIHNKTDNLNILIDESIQKEPSNVNVL